MPEFAMPCQAGLILVPGIEGLTNKAPLQRSKSDYVARGLAVLCVDKGADLGAAVKYMSKLAAPVAVAAVSAGVLRAAAAIRRGRLRAQRLVLVSGNLQVAQRNIGDPKRLPPTLVIHHRKDACSETRPDAVEPFVKWSGGSASVKWLEGGSNAGDPCLARSHHGLAGLDDQVVTAITEYMR
jgi:hypothetical protein